VSIDVSGRARSTFTAIYAAIAGVWISEGWTASFAIFPSSSAVPAGMVPGMIIRPVPMPTIMDTRRKARHGKNGTDNLDKFHNHSNEVSIPYRYPSSPNEE